MPVGPASAAAAPGPSRLGSLRSTARAVGGSKRTGGTGSSVGNQPADEHAAPARSRNVGVTGREDEDDEFQGVEDSKSESIDSEGVASGSELESGDASDDSIDEADGGGEEGSEYEAEAEAAESSEVSVHNVLRVHHVHAIYANSYPVADSVGQV